MWHIFISQETTVIFKMSISVGIFIHSHFFFNDWTTMFFHPCFKKKNTLINNQQANKASDFYIFLDK